MIFLVKIEYPNYWMVQKNRQKNLWSPKSGTLTNTQMEVSDKKIPPNHRFYIRILHEITHPAIGVPKNYANLQVIPLDAPIILTSFFHKYIMLKIYHYLYIKISCYEVINIS
jgi:uncharacterized protein (UPF0128 family)